LSYVFFVIFFILSFTPGESCQVKLCLVSIVKIGGYSHNAVYEYKVQPLN